MHVQVNHSCWRVPGFGPHTHHSSYISRASEIPSLNMIGFFPEHLNTSCHMGMLTQTLEEKKHCQLSIVNSLGGPPPTSDQCPIFLRWCILKLNSEWFCNLGMTLTIDSHYKQQTWQVGRLINENSESNHILHYVTYKNQIYGWQNTLVKLTHIKSKKYTGC